MLQLTLDLPSILADPQYEHPQNKQRASHRHQQRQQSPDAVFFTQWTRGEWENGTSHLSDSCNTAYRPSSDLYWQHCNQYIHDDWVERSKDKPQQRNGDAVTSDMLDGPDNL
jgi:hypothetical protein